MVEVINYKVRADGKVYKKGEVIDSLSKKEELRLEKLGFVKVIEAKVKNPGIEDMTVDDAKQLVDGAKSIEQLNRLMEEEKEGKNRVSLIRFIEERIAEIKEEQE